MIPRTIHYFWIGDSPKPKTVLYCIESWKKICPGYQIIEWNETNYDFSKNKYMMQAYQKKKWGFVPDFARMDIVLEQGGIYLDTDVELIRPLDGLLDNKAFMGFEKTTEKEHFVACGLGFGAEPGNILIREMRDEYQDISFVDDEGNMNLLPSPQYNTRVLKRHGLKNEDRDQLIGDIMIYASDVLCPKMYCSSKTHLTERTVSIHHYDATWLEGERKKLHDRNVRLNVLLGDSLGNKTAKAMEDTEYLYKSLGKRIKRVLKRG